MIRIDDRLRTSLRMTLPLLLLLSSAAPAAAQHPEGYIRMPDGVELYYRTAGTGPDTVIVPGRLFLYDDFARLAAGRYLIFYDMRGRGRSDSVADSTTLTISQDVADLEAVRQHFGVARASLIGYSYLGLMVVLYAAEHPATVRRIVQLGPVGPRPTAQYPPHLTANDTVSPFDAAAVAHAAALRAEGFDRSNPREYCEIAWSINRFALVGDPSRVEQLGPGYCTMPNEWPISLSRHFRHGFESVQRVQVTDDQIGRVSIPVLTIHGTKDRNAPYGGGREWAARLPDARLLTIPGAAHHSWAEAPEVLRAVDRFLSGSSVEGAERISSARDADATRAAVR